MMGRVIFYVKNLVLWLLTLLRSALEQKKADEQKEFGAIDYDAPVEPEKKTIGLGTKVKLQKLFVFFHAHKCIVYCTDY